MSPGPYIGALSLDPGTPCAQACFTNLNSKTDSDPEDEVKEFTDRYWDDGHWRLCSQEHRESFIEVQPNALKESSKADVQVGSLAPKADPMYLCDRHRLGTSTYIECRHAWLLCHR